MSMSNISQAERRWGTADQAKLDQHIVGPGRTPHSLDLLLLLEIPWGSGGLVEFETFTARPDGATATAFTFQAACRAESEWADTSQRD
jgi:hypothetical protein